MTPPRSFAIDVGALIAAGVEWVRLHDGVDICRLYGDGREGASAALLRYAPNAYLPLHEHEGREHVFVLAGLQEDDSGVYPAGTMVVNPPRSRHRVRSPEGCLVLVLWEQPVTFLPEP
jgi:anti-sigma factor ChrR (cupin superfamily)